MQTEKKTALYDWHLEHEAKMVNFAGYSMPVNYVDGVLKEHLWVRENAGLFDVSHMGQVVVTGLKSKAGLAAIFPVDIDNLSTFSQCYTLLMNHDAGIIDDLMLAKREHDFLLVLNASRKEIDLNWLKQLQLPEIDFFLDEERALLALQGPCAVQVLLDLGAAIDNLAFMSGCWVNIKGISCWITRSGYTGEDGFEISVANHEAAQFAQYLVNHRSVKPIGLGARDSLRLEAGLCLYGHELTEKTTPQSAQIAWAIAKARRPNGENALGFIGANNMYIDTPQKKIRIGLVGEDRLPVREGADILNEQGVVIGKVTSGTFSPCLQKPIAMAYIDAEYQSSQQFYAKVRKKTVLMQKHSLPFVPHRYYRG